MSIELKRLKNMLQITDNNSDSLLTELLLQCEEEAIAITHQTDSAKLLPIIRLMAVEKYNKLGNEGINSIGYSGITESYKTDYSEQVVRLLKSKTRLVLR